MRSLVLFSLLAVGSLGCEPKPSGDAPSKETAAKTPPQTPLARDVDRICNAEEQSGALHEEPNARASHVAIWLATNLESDEGRALSRELVGLAPEPRKERLRLAAAEQTHGDCEILRSW